MTVDDDLLRRAMDAAPEAWLDRLVTERVLLEVQSKSAVSARDAVARNAVARNAVASDAGTRNAVANTAPAGDVASDGKTAPTASLWAQVRARIARLLSLEARPLMWRDGDQRG